LNVVCVDCFEKVATDPAVRELVRAAKLTTEEHEWTCSGCGEKYQGDFCIRCTETAHLREDASIFGMPNESMAKAREIIKAHKHENTPLGDAASLLSEAISEMNRLQLYLRELRATDPKVRELVRAVGKMEQKCPRGPWNEEWCSRFCNNGNQVICRLYNVLPDALKGE
jgi:hypothetical protein